MYKLCRNCDNVYNDEEHSSCPKCSGPIFHPPYPCATLQKEQTDKVAEKAKTVNPIIKFLCNLLGFAVGFVAIEAIAFVTTWLFIEVIGSVDFITSFLSWPVDYGTYAYSTIIVTEAFGGIYLCAKISQLSKSDFSYSCFLLALFRIIVNGISQWKEFGSDKIRTLSMGMSDDYRIALEHSSNMVRIGTYLFEE